MLPKSPFWTEVSLQNRIRFIRKKYISHQSEAEKAMKWAMMAVNIHPHALQVPIGYAPKAAP